MRRNNGLCVACVIDDDIAGKIKAADTSNNRAKYDISVVQVLRSICRDVKLVRAFDESSRTIRELTRLQHDVVFNLAFSAHPLEASFAGGLDVLGIPYTGSGPLGIALSNDKIRSRHLLRSAGLQVPRFVELPIGRPITIDFEPPFIVKPISLASSAGIYADSVVMTRKDVPRLARRIWRQHEVPAMCDEFVVGREFRIGMIEGPSRSFAIVGISEWKFGLAAPGWGFKTEAIRLNRKVRQARQVTRSLAPLSQRESRKLNEAARNAVEAVDIRGYATVDVRMDERHDVTVIEANANPGLWSGSAIWSNPSFEINIRRILNAALRRKKG
jgi:D-alanine-D-alanine ligase